MVWGGAALGTPRDSLSGMDVECVECVKTARLCQLQMGLFSAFPVLHFQSEAFFSWMGYLPVDTLVVRGLVKAQSLSLCKGFLASGHPLAEVASGQQKADLLLEKQPQQRKPPLLSMCQMFVLKCSLVGDLAQW